MPQKRSKRYAQAQALAEPREYLPGEACEVIGRTSMVKFDASVEAHVRLGVDPRHADEMVRGTVSLPHGTGRTVRVLVFAQGEKAAEAEQAGADFVGAEDLVKRIEGGWTDFDVALATPDLMGQVGRLGRILGPRGLMPNPKSGTVTFEVAKGVSDFKAGRVEFRTDRYGIVHAVIGRASFAPEALLDNLTALIDTLVRLKPAASKGQYLKTLYLSTAMGPSISVDAREAAKLKAA